MYLVEYGFASILLVCTCTSDANEIHKGANLSCRMMLHITSKQSNQITKEDYKQHSRRQQKYVCIYLCSSLIQK